MREFRILLSPLRHVRQGVPGTENPQRADPHHRAIGLAVWVRVPPQATVDGRSATERLGVQPGDVGLPGFLSVIPADLHQNACQRQGQFGRYCQVNRFGA